MITLEIDLNTLIFLLDIDQVLIRLPSHLMAIVRKFNLEKKTVCFLCRFRGTKYGNSNL